MLKLTQKEKKNKKIELPFPRKKRCGVQINPALIVLKTLSLLKL